MDEILDVDGEVFSMCEQRASEMKKLSLFATHAVPFQRKKRGS